jgi:TolB-like protein/DNA-binding SARP family transcriptional activator/Flp pilus assembly protein TadD
MDTADAFGNGSERPARWSLRLLGGFELSALHSGETVTSLGKRERVLLAYLALSPSFRQPRHKLATLLWGDATDETALDNLRTCLFNLRKALGDAEHRVIASQGKDKDIVLDGSSFEVDALALRQLAAQPDRKNLAGAAGLYAGEFLDGLGIESDEFESWRRTEAARYRDQAVDALTRLMSQLTDCGETDRAIETGLRLLTLDPLHEAAARRLMRLYAQSGRRGAAIQLYRTLAGALRSEIDAEPEAETRAVFAEVSRGRERHPVTSPLGAIPAQPPLPSGAIARPSDAPGESPSSSKRPALRLRVPAAILAGVVTTAVALLSYGGYALLSPRQGIDVEREAAASEASAVSIAVLPFLNLSGDPGQDFFSDGMTEEITTALARIPDLKVVARTSAFQFKSQDRDVQSIGQQLHATHLIEGSVRREGDRVRVVAQLIEADSGLHLRVESYDRQLADIFATQEEVAKSIVSALMTPLGLAPGEQLISNRNIDPESYQQYLRARQLVRARTRGAAQAIEILEPLVARNPDFAPGWVQLSRAYAAAIVASENAPAEELRRIRVDYALKRSAAARRALELDPNSPDANWALAMSHVSAETLPLREELLAKALALDPNNADILTSYSTLLLRVGRLKDALPIRQQAVALEPFVPVYTGNLGEALWLNGQNEAALAVLKSGPRGNSRSAEIARVYASMGRFGDAADQVLELPEALYPRELVADASRLLRTAPANAAAPDSLPRLASLGFVYLYIGAPMRALEFHEELGETGGGGTLLLWHSSYAPLRKTERFKALMRKVGLVDYWRAKGWPEFCHPTTGDDFVCE